MSIKFKHEANKPDAFNVRANVFMVEQGFSYDFDRLDDNDEVIHITAYDEGLGSALVGAARIFPAELEWQYPDYLDASNGCWVVGRIAVLPEARHAGLGTEIIEEAERVALLHGASEMHLHAQVRAMPFYKKQGYIEYGGLEDDEGVAHQWMRKKLI